MNISSLTAAYWHREWKRMLCMRLFDQACLSWANYQEWKRRATIEDMLTEICEEKNFGGVYDRE